MFTHSLSQYITCSQGKAYLYQIEEGGKIINSLTSLIPINFKNEQRLFLHEQINPSHVQKLLKEFINNPVQIKPLIITHESIQFKEVLSKSLAHALLIHEIAIGNNQYHRLFALDHQFDIQSLSEQLNAIQHMCIADGHHRFSAISTYYQNYHQNAYINNHPHVLATLFYTKDLATKARLVLIENEKNTKDEQIKLLNKKFNLKKLLKPSIPAKSFHYTLFFQNEWFILSPKLQLMEEAREKGLLDIEFFKNLILRDIFDITHYTQHHRFSIIYSDSAIDEIMTDTKNSSKICFILKGDSPSNIFKFAKNNRLLEPNSTCFTPKLLENIICHDLLTSTIIPVNSLTTTK